ncbi:hypothetical protein ACHAWF_006533 [Thalassiosira exigua]
MATPPPPAPAASAADEPHSDPSSFPPAASSSSTSPSTSSSSSESRVETELRRLRGELFDLSESTESVGPVWDAVRRLAECEHRVVEGQRIEIERLRVELGKVREERASGDGAEAEGRRAAEIATRSSAHPYYAGLGTGPASPGGLESIPSFDSIAMVSSSEGWSAGGFTAESERPTSYSLLQNQHLAQRATLSQSLASLREDVGATSAEWRRLNSSKDDAAGELRELLATKGRIEDEIDDLRRQAKLLLSERNKLVQEVEVHGHQAELACELEAAKESVELLEREAGALREGTRRAEERAAAAARETAAADEERERSERDARGWRERAERLEGRLDRALGEKESIAAKREADAAARREAEDRAAKESLTREEMEKEMRALYERQISGEKTGGGPYEPKAKASFGAGRADDVRRLKREIDALQGENASLRSGAERDSRAIAGLNAEIQSLMSGGGEVVAAAAKAVAPTPVASNAQGSSSSLAQQQAAASRKRALILSQGWAGREAERKRSIRYEPPAHGARERIDSAGSGSLEMIEGTSHGGPQRSRLGSDGEGSKSAGRTTLGSDTVSALQEEEEEDRRSLLFGTEGVVGKGKGRKGGGGGGGDDDEKSDHDGIRAHAEKLLYWAEKASERSKKSDASVASRAAGAGASAAASAVGAGGQAASSSPIPKTIGLPPRSQSRRSVGVGDGLFFPVAGGDVRRRRDREHHPPEQRQGERRGDVQPRPQDATGAFPALPPSTRRRKKNVSVSEDEAVVIHNLDYVDEAPIVCCECSVSPFSGNDPQSEFYLPKLGMACGCGGVGVGSDAIDVDRASFARDPAALSNILRPWQCDFLASRGVSEAPDLLRAHKSDANAVARDMKRWRAEHGMEPRRSRECYVALKIWSRTCKVVLRSVREQRELARRNAAEGGVDEEDVIVEKPHFLDITFADTHTIASISTLGQLSSVGGGGRPLEMMEI